MLSAESFLFSFKSVEKCANALGRPPFFHPYFLILLPQCFQVELVAMEEGLLHAKLPPLKFR